MTDLRSSWDEIAARIRAAGSVLVLSDFDGTLVPLVDHPARVEVPDGVREILLHLIDLPKCAVGIVSGRALLDLISQIAIPGLWYVGNHGYEIRTPDGQDLRFFDVADLRVIDLVAKDMARVLAPIPGVHLEPKGPILAVHYRQVEPARAPEVEKLFIDVLDRHHDRVLMARGKCVLEARLRAPVTKASAVRNIRNELPPHVLPIYFGDDLTDHDVFRELRDQGLTISVGKGDLPLAQYTLPGPQAVVEVLWRIGAVLGGTAGPSGTGGN